MAGVKKFIHEWIWVILLIFCVGGLMYPAIGIAAIVCMLAPVVVAFFRGRAWCGSFCPRGSFSDSILTKISMGKYIPKVLKTAGFRVLFLVLLMSAFAVQLTFAWGDAVKVGTVFVRMILITTLLTLILGVVFKPRTWCTFCPMGTMASYVTRMKSSLKAARQVVFHKDRCINCRLCSKRCPMEIEVLEFKEEGSVVHPDCIKCGVCVQQCPRKALEIKKL